jgi:hypothetical protein
VSRLTDEQEKHVEDLCRNIWQMASQAPHDFVGEQRDFYLPKLQHAMVCVGMIFSAQMARVVDEKDQGAT